MDYKNVIELIINNLEEGIIVVDSNLNIRYFNESSRNITGFDPKEAIGKNILQVFPNIKKENSTFHKVINSKTPIIEHVQNYINYVGKSVSIVTSTIPIINDGKIEGAIEIFKDLTNVVELSEKILMLQSTLHGKDVGFNKFFQNGTQYHLSDMIGQSKLISELKLKVQKVANSNSPVFVFGETGTGKELVVQGLHNLSYRRNKPFIAQNCGALPENLLESILFGTVQGSFTGAKDKQGLFELADGGTLFLDELNSMKLGLQSKLLRVIEDGMVRRVGSTKTTVVDVRLVVASNEEPKKLVKENKLREDLYYRLNVLNISIPPLRNRKEDIPILVEHFIKICNDKMDKSVKSVDKHVMEYFLNNDWPGNVRELQNTIEGAMNFAEDEYIRLEDLQTYNGPYTKNIEMEHFEHRISKDIGLKMAVEEYEKNIIKLALDEAGNNYAQAARNLKIPKQTLYSKLKKYKINEKEGSLL
ncbi:sigma 54-interacting transcriptional regulator [Tissierella sp. MB52-C2]|uniref:sigma-54 interaction domain-containing protein n=1 Tax=Tissierella sp. MB52-C2 TaxID=3070999 RepID=UPI00280B8FF8|nr:sigma 54-interacting transcriptional regulator [Tissierella sp. MB52-C2]WMM24469.1 sigma 54-interacting transcriptional regulator [Tissierella sp. MB52-C2]